MGYFLSFLLSIIWLTQAVPFFRYGCVKTAGAPALCGEIGAVAFCIATIAIAVMCWMLIRSEIKNDKIVNKVKEVFASILVTVILFVIWSYSSIGDASRRFIKLDGVVTIYTGIFFCLGFVFLVLCRQRIRRASWIKTSLYSVAAGYLLSLSILLVAEAAITVGVERISNSVQIMGVGNFLFMQLLLAGILAGWFYGLLGAIGLKLISKALG
ncbi:hypothetical protein [Bdellovibrio sp. HCB209]|uniref:hypothetical protein n=1 Tax=Bdellovibrio sp. HCB209 TaxID=3394354 RepID=UPI0039B4874C